MNSSFFVKQGENNDNGSVQINLSVDILKSFSIPLPSMEKQKRIAFFLDSIDKKIDNNNVISAELEGMAKDLYDTGSFSSTSLTRTASPTRAAAARWSGMMS